LIARRAGVRYSITGITITVPTARIYLFFECLFTVMKIMLNGQEKSFKTPLTVSALLQDMGLGERRVAVEVNREIVPRSLHEGFQLQDNDRVEVVFAIGGGGYEQGAGRPPSAEQGLHAVGMRPAANAAGHRQHGLSVFQKVFGGVVHGSYR